MKMLLFILLLIIFSLCIGEFVAQTPGSVIFAYGHWTLQMPLWIFLLCSIFLFFIFYLVLRSWHGIKHLQLKAKQRQGTKQHKKTLQMAEEAIFSMIEGNPKKTNNALNYMKKLPNLHFFYLLGKCALATQEKNEFTLTENINALKRAYPNKTATFDLFAAKIAYHLGAFERSLPILQNLLEQNSKNTEALKYWAKVQMKLNNWEALSKQLTQLKKYHCLDEESLKLIREKIEKRT